MEKSQQDCIAQMESKDFIMEPAIFACLKRFVLFLHTDRLALLSVREVWVQITTRSNRMLCRQRLATAATLLPNGVAHALSHGDVPRRSLHASA